MNSKLINAGIALLGVGAVGIILAIVMEIQTAEPVYFILMKVTAALFGVGGPLLGIGIARKARGKKKGR